MKRYAILIQGLALSTLIALSPWMHIDSAQADTRPPSGTPVTVSADPLPTVQINGIVWAQVTVGNIVYVTGNFTKARPAGSALGQNEETRQHLLAYDIRNGKLLNSFNHNMNNEGRAITASPDGSRVYVGGKFTSVDGRAVNRIAAFNTSDGSLVTSFNKGPTNGVVKALAATNNAVYAGGTFSAVSGGHSRTRLVAYDSRGALTPWDPSANRDVMSMVMTPDNSKVVIGGSFDKIRNTTFYGLGAITAASPGHPVTTWASASSTFPIHMNDVNNSAGITSLSKNGSLIFLTAYSYHVADKTKKFEGRAAIRPSDGKLVWMNDCLGDTYSAVPIGNVLYSAGHSHDCRRIGGFPEIKSVRLLAETMTVDGANANIPMANYWNHAGQPRSSLLNWFPLLNTGTKSGASQAAWSVTGNSQYVSAGGEFTKAGTMNQQGLVRYAVSSLAPNKQGPSFKGFAIRNGFVKSDGKSGLAIRTASDPDNGVLTYRVYRNGSTTPIHTFTYDTRFWNTPEYHNFIDSGLAPGSVPHYRVTATDPFGNTATSYSLIDDWRGIQYGGSGWINAQGRGQGDYWDGIHYTTSNGAHYTYTFSGTGFELISHRNKYTGRISVQIDGGPATTINTYNSTHMGAQKSIYTKSGLTRGTHTVKVTKVDGTNMVIDGIRIIP